MARSKPRLKTSAGGFGRTGLTGRGNRSDRSNRILTGWAPQHLNHSLLSPQPLSLFHHAQPELRLSPSHFSPQTLAPQSHPFQLIQGLERIKSAWGSFIPSIPSLGCCGFKHSTGESFSQGILLDMNRSPFLEGFRWFPLVKSIIMNP